MSQCMHLRTGDWIDQTVEIEHETVAEAKKGWHLTID